MGDTRGGNWGCHPSIFSEKPETGDLFFAFYCFHSGVTSLEGVTPHLFYLSDLVSPLFFVNLPTNFFPSGVKNVSWPHFSWTTLYIGNSHASHGIPVGMEIAKLVSWKWEWEREGMKTPHFPISRPQVADHQTLLMHSCFGIVISIYHRLHSGCPWLRHWEWERMEGKWNGTEKDVPTHL